MQPYLLSARSGIPEHVHQTMQESLGSYLEGIERALETSACVASDQLTLADIAFACELGLFSNEASMTEALSQAGLDPLLPRVREKERVRAHLLRLAEHPHFAVDLADYFGRMELDG